MLKPFNKGEARISFAPVGEPIEAGHEAESCCICEDSQLGCNVFVKKIQQHRLAEDEFFREASILYKSSHPNIAKIMYACKDNEYIYIVMKHYKNGSLGDKIRKEYLTPREIIKISIEILCGLQNIHSKKLLHLDIKPDNILLSDRGEAKITDFGLSAYMNDEGWGEVEGAYDPHCPPEFEPCAEVSRQYDIYQFGMTMYRMCVGEEEFDRQVKLLEQSRDPVEKIRRGHFPDKNKIPLHLGRPLQNILKKCLHVDPRHRYASCIEILNSLARLEGNSLDWKYCGMDDEGAESWIRVDGDASFHITRWASTGKCIVTKGKKVQRRVTDFCKEEGTSDDTLRKAFSEV